MQEKGGIAVFRCLIALYFMTCFYGSDERLVMAFNIDNLKHKHVYVTLQWLHTSFPPRNMLGFLQLSII